jgi:hypothetical protein
MPLLAGTSSLGLASLWCSGFHQLPHRLAVESIRRLDEDYKLGSRPSLPWIDKKGGSGSRHQEDPMGSVPTPTAAPLQDNFQHTFQQFTTVARGFTEVQRALNETRCVLQGAQESLYELHQLLHRSGILMPHSKTKLGDLIIEKLPKLPQRGWFIRE